MAESSSSKKRSGIDAGSVDGGARKKPKSALKHTSTTGQQQHQQGQQRATLTLSSSLRAGRYSAALALTAGFELPEGLTYAVEAARTSSSSTKAGKAAAAKSRQGQEAAIYMSAQDDVMFYHNTNWRPQPVAHDGKRPPADRGYSGEYLLGVHDQDTNTVTLHRAPLFTVTRLISSLQNLSAIKGDGLDQAADWESRVAARRNLGDVFGTRKAKATVRAQDRLKVDATHMGAMLTEVADGITEAAAVLPTAENISQVENQGRPTPVPNLGATNPADVYPPTVLIPSNILSVLPIPRLTKCEDEDSMRKILPQPGPSRSDWICTRMWALVKRVQANSSHGEGGILRTNRDEARSKLRMAFYLCLLFAFRNNRGSLADKATLMGRLRIDGATGGEQIADDLLSRFAETPRGGGKPAITSLCDTRIYTHICALALHLDDFAVNPGDFAAALSIPTAKLTDYFKAIGCTSSDVSVPVSTPSANALETTTNASMRKERRLVLKLPLKFPENKRRGPAKNR